MFHHKFQHKSTNDTTNIANFMFHDQFLLKPDKNATSTANFYNSWTIFCIKNPVKTVFSIAYHKFQHKPIKYANNFTNFMFH